MEFTAEQRKTVSGDFLSRSVNRAETLDTIKDFHNRNGYLLDPHTAVGVKAGLDHLDQEAPVICLATAHPAKFDEAVVIATGKKPDRPDSLKGIERLPTRCETLDNDLAQVRLFIERSAI